MTEIQRDIKIFYNPITHGEFGDVEIDAGDFVLDGGLETPVLISLFSDMRVDKKESFDNSTRGFWAEKLIGFNLGSKIWLLDRSKINQNKTLRRLEQYTKDALKWMVDDGIYSRVETAALKSKTRINTIELYIAAYKPDDLPDKFKYAIQWNVQLGRV